MEINRKVIAGGGGITAAFVVCCMQFIQPHEGTLHKAYSDTGGIYTICSGHTKGVKKGDIATPAQCDQYFKADTLDAIVELNFLTDNQPMPDATRKVFVDEIFNAGVGNFERSTMRKMIRLGDLEGACKQFPRWKFVGGKDCTVRSNNCYGIITRRAEQEAACLKGLKDNAP